MSKPEVTLDTMIGNIKTALEEQYLVMNQIRREGRQLIVPEHMTFKDAAKSLIRWEKEMEDEETNDIEIQGHPSDTLIAFQNAMKSTFGALIGRSEWVPTFFGMMKRPSKTKHVQISSTERIPVTYGRVEVPGLPIKLKVGVDKDRDNLLESTLFVEARYVKKYAPLVKMIEDGIRKELAENSIFKGKAIDSQFDFLNLDGFPLSRITYSRKEETELNAHVFRIIRSTDQIKKERMPIKRTILLHGKFGTGKTLTALLAANICTENGWTFMNVRPGDSIVEALNFAKAYQPCLVFFEDIDQETDGERDGSINQILNTVDGLLSKNSEVMCILTTNNADKIEKAMMRPGRIDAVIEMGTMDRDSMSKLIQNHLNHSINGNIDWDRLMKLAEGYTPSFITEACNRAQLYAMDRSNGDGMPELTQEDLEGALTGLRSQYELMNQDREMKTSGIEMALSNLVNREVNGLRSDVFDMFKYLKDRI